MPSFDLLTEKWLPCIILPSAPMELRADAISNGGRFLAELGIKQALLQAQHIGELVGDSPPVTIALHRLLLAILHRALQGPRDEQEWGQLWRNKTWGLPKLESYFSVCANKFDLFHEERPFYQTATLDFEKSGSVAQICFPPTDTLFDHANTNNLPTLSPATAARMLIAFQSFDVGGIKTAEVDKDFAKAAPLLQSAISLVRGGNLFETLMLNLHRYDPEDGEPFEFTLEKDLPAWEQEAIVKPIERFPDGYVDLLTLQSRRVRLQPIQDESSKLIVRQTVMMKGYQLPDRFDRHDKELMIPFKKNEKAKDNQLAWFTIGFNENKALWRDSLSLFQTVEEKQVKPKMLSWLNDLMQAGFLDRAKSLPIDFCGLAADKAKLLFWRHEHFDLPLAYLDDAELLDQLGTALSLAERIAKEVIEASAKELAKFLLSPGVDQTNGRKPDEGKDVRPLAESFTTAMYYWSRLEAPFKQLLLALPLEEAVRNDESRFNQRALHEWANILSLTAKGAFNQTINSLSGSAVEQKAVVAAQKKFDQAMGRIRKENTQFFPDK